MPVKDQRFGQLMTTLKLWFTTQFFVPAATEVNRRKRAEDRTEESKTAFLTNIRPRRKKISLNVTNATLNR